jgi:hypothetical protein
MADQNVIVTRAPAAEALAAGKSPAVVANTAASALAEPFKRKLITSPFP